MGVLPHLGVLTRLTLLVLFRVCFLSMRSGPGSLPRGGTRRQNLVHVQSVVFLCQSFLEVHILTTNYQKPLILKPQVPCRVDLHSITSHPRVNAGGGARGQNLVLYILKNVGFLRQNFLEVHILTTTYQKAFILDHMYHVGFSLIP